jgi:hypothetical protein
VSIPETRAGQKIVSLERHVALSASRNLSAEHFVPAGRGPRAASSSAVVENQNKFEKSGRPRLSAGQLTKKNEKLEIIFSSLYQGL